MNYAEAPGMKQQIGGADRVFQFAATTNPGETGETNARGFSGGRIELVVCIDDGADFASPGGGGKNMQEAGCAAGGAGTSDFGDGTPQ